MPQLTIEIPAIALSIEYDKKISITAIVSIVFEIARMTLKQILEQINETLVEEYCGKKYERGKEFKRHSKKKRTISTLLGEVTLNLTRVRGKKTITPLYDVVEFESKRKYQSDVKAISVDSALKMTYRDARDEINRFTSSPSHQTIWRYTQELGEEVNREFKANVYFSTDTTKFSRKSKVELVIVEGENVVVRANKSYKEIREELNLQLIALGDADRRLSIFEERQIDLIHVFREVNYKLWQHGVDLSVRRKYVNEVKGILLRLKNSLDSLSEEKIKETGEVLEEFVREMDRKGFWRVSRFFRKHRKSILLFAYKRLEGAAIPWHNNKMERKMGEISKRMKNKWMSWSAKGAENLAGLLMKKKYEREFYEMFLVKVMKLDRNIRWEVNFNP